MKESGTIRFLDRYVGSALCFFLSFFKGKTPTHRGKKILFLELFEMGAAVMAYSSIEYIKKVKPDAEFYCLCLKGNHQSWELLGEIPQENIITIDGSSLVKFAFSVLKQLLVLRKLKIDIVLNLEKFSRISTILSFLSNAKIQAGFYRYEYEGLYRGSLLDVNCAFNQNMHIAKNLLALAKAAVSQEQEYPNYKGSISNAELSVPQYSSLQNLKEKMVGRIRAVYPTYDNQPLILVSPDVGPNLSVRNYPLHSFADVIDRILKKYPDSLVLIIGVYENEKICSSLVKRVNSKNCLNFCGKTDSVKDLMELIFLAKLLITNDNGPAHFAALTPTKVLALFSTDSPYMYGPLGSCLILYTFFHCSPCISALNNKRSKCKNNLCLQALAPQRVFEFAVGLLENRVKTPSLNGQSSYLLDSPLESTVAQVSPNSQRFLKAG